jgi:uncharacterized protein
MSVFRIGGISYLRIPAPDPLAAARFYGSVFGWDIDLERDDPSFTDGTGHVIGHFMRDLPVARGAGIVPYVYVADVDAVTEKAVSQGGKIETARYPEGNLWVAVITDPAGNRIGVWQQSNER